MMHSTGMADINPVPRQHDVHIYARDSVRQNNLSIRIYESVTSMGLLFSLLLPILLALHNLINFASRKTRTRSTIYACVCVCVHMEDVYIQTREIARSLICPGLINSFPILN